MGTSLCFRAGKSSAHGWATKLKLSTDARERNVAPLRRAARSVISSTPRRSQTGGDFEAQCTLFFHERGGRDGIVADGEADDGRSLLDDEGCAELRGYVVGVGADAGGGCHGDAW
jgi:hypothetical protein